MEFDLEKQVKILKKKIYNEKRQKEDFSPVTRNISPIMNRSNIDLNKTSKRKINDVSLFSTHIINSKNIQIVKLPKLPYGKHQNYNNDEMFVNSHFIDIKEKAKNNVLEHEIRKFKLFKKKAKKIKQSSPDTLFMPEKSQKYYIYKTEGGKLYSNKEKDTIRLYDLSKNGAIDSSSSYKVLPKLSTSPFNEKSNPTVSLKNLISRLYKVPEKKSTNLLNSLSQKILDL